MKTPTDIIICRSREEWRDWLLNNHKLKKEQWIAIFKKKYTYKGISYDEAVEEAICFGWIDGLMKAQDNEKFILRFSPRRYNSPWSLKNKNRAEQMILEGKMTPAGIDMINDAKKSGWWEHAYSLKDKHEIPGDLEKALRTDSKAWNNFNNLSNSDKSRYIIWINTAKQKETRERRIQSVLDRIMGLS